ncbi:MAG: acyl carrier protein [Paraburkholderia sp.]|nr:MAG: acyl carrier protein [Paraburkholderia sp.]
MNDTDVRAVVVATLKSIAPELEEPALRDDRPLRLQVDLDSIDWLNFLLRLHERLDVEIPESDYQRLVTIADIAAYLVKKMNPPHKSGR